MDRAASAGEEKNLPEQKHGSAGAQRAFCSVLVQKNDALWKTTLSAAARAVGSRQQRVQCYVHYPARTSAHNEWRNVLELRSSRSLQRFRG